MAGELAYDAMIERGPNSRASAIIRRLAARGREYVVQQHAIGKLPSIKLEKQTQEQLALRWIKGAADRHRDAAADRGSDVHAEAEKLVLEHARAGARLLLDRPQVLPWPEEIAGYRLSFMRFIEDWRPEFLAAEATVFHETQAYAGTLDTIVRLTAGEILARLVDDPRGTQEAALRTWLRSIPADAPVVVIIDFKSGRAVWPEVSLQLAAYAHATFIGAPDGVTRIPMPEVDLGAVLHLRGDGTYQLRLVRIDGQIFQAFCFAREVFRFQIETSKTVLMQDLTPAHAPDLAEVAS